MQIWDLLHQEEEDSLLHCIITEKYNTQRCGDGDDAIDGIPFHVTCSPYYKDMVQKIAAACLLICAPRGTLDEDFLARQTIHKDQCIVGHWDAL